MTYYDRSRTAAARREIMNKHLYRDHNKAMAPAQGETLDEKYARHLALHEAGDCGHEHEDFSDLSKDFGHYLTPKPLRVRKDRVPKKWTITYHLALDHGSRILGDTLVKQVEHEKMHDTNPDGWGGLPGRIHRHPDIWDPATDIEYREESPE